MGKIIKLTESDLVKIIKKVLTEEKIITDYDKSFDYKKDGNKFYFRGKGKFKSKYPEWTLAKGKGAIESIKTKVFKEDGGGEIDVPQIDNETPKTFIEKEVEKKENEKVSKKGTPDEVIKFLTNKGLTVAQAAGVAGNLQHESGINPTVKPGDGGTSFGIAQWHKERGKRMKEWTKQNGYDSTTLQGQLEYLWWELKNTEKRALDKLKETDDPKDAAFMFAKYFERCAACQDRSRVKGRLTSAQKFHDEY